MTTDTIYTIIIVAVVVIAIAAWLIWFFCLPRKDKIEKIKLWLLGAVTDAEKELGTKTGQLKLAKVYGWMIDKFKIVGMLLSLEKFNALVDEALDKMREMLETNDAVKKLIEGETIAGEETKEKTD